MPNELLEPAVDADNQEAEAETEGTAPVGTTILSETEGTGSAETTTPTTNAKPNYYTPEEVEELIKLDKDIDTSRLTPEGQLILKSMQRGFVPKFQQVAEERRRLQELQAQAQSSRPMNARTAYFEQYMADPQRVIAEINAEITNLAQIAPMTNEFEPNPEYQPSQVKIAQLQALKDEFNLQRQIKLEEDSKWQNISNALTTALYAEMPDYDTRRVKLVEYAKGLGITDEAINIVTNPQFVGAQTAYEVVKAINKLYSAVKGVESKRKKPAPLEHGGARIEAEKAKSVSEMSFPEFSKYWKGKQSGI